RRCKTHKPRCESKIMSRKLFESVSFRAEATEVASVPTLADPNYLPRHIVGGFLSWLWRNGKYRPFAGAMILLCIPVRTDRIESMREVSDTDALLGATQADVIIDRNLIVVPVFLRDRIIARLPFRLPEWWVQRIQTDA